MYSLQHPQIDERFLDSESTVEEVVKLLENLRVPQEEEEGVDQAVVQKDPKPMILTDDNFIITDRKQSSAAISASKDTVPKNKSIPRTFKRIDRSKDRFPFMRQVEMDLDQRSKARLERERVAQNFRKLGNAEYRKGNYETAMKMYTEAIENIRDSHILYINRALCFIKSGKYKRGIVDCDFVLNKLDEKNLRAWMYRAMAYKGLNDESNFENCVKYARKFNSKQMEFIDNFLEKLK
ncbi:tetratricopeptide repeat protein 12 [Drosophila ficusphila]|uniref:tetratricopeptide repeat protein 12 n=1 Tax=Drosophila ficusphila TaxID=30025 RepID=UPI001C89AB93|nr:tetratricopeptide repeat protein 12 [Drosophila ficusphila]